MRQEKNSRATALNKDQQRLVTENLEFAQNIGKKHAGLAIVLGLTVEDVQQDACYGLCVAALNFSPNAQASFLTYAYDWCKKFVFLSLRREYRALTVDKCIDILGDKLPDENPLDELALQKRIKELFHMLNSKERMVIRRVYGFNADGPKTFRQIALEMHLTSARVHDIYEQAMEKLNPNTPQT